MELILDSRIRDDERLKLYKIMNRAVKDIMTTPVVTTTIEVTTGYVRELMERKQVSAIPIVQLNGQKIVLKGIITTSDLRGITDEDTPVDLFMSRQVESVAKETSLKEAAKKMVKKDLHHLVVMDNEKMVGIISSMDFVEMASE